MKILAAIDGSSFSNFVVEELSLRKWPNYSTVKLVTIINTDDSKQPNIVQTVEQNLKAIAKHLSQIYSEIKIQTEVRQGNNAREELLKLAIDWHAELIIVAAHGKGALERMLLGSVSEAFLEHGMVPVLVAKQGPSNTQGNSLNILVPTDNSLYSIKATEWLLKQSWTKPVNLKLLTVLPPISEQYASEQDPEKAADMLKQQQEMKNEFMAILRQWEAHIHQHIAPASLEFQILEGIPQDEILSEAKKWPANLIVMGSHGRTGLTRYLIGSVARAVSQNAQCSVEIVRLPDFEEYSRRWESFDKKVQLEDLKKSGDYHFVHAE